MDNNEKLERTNKTKSIVIIILAVLLLALGSYMCYDKFIKKQENEDNTQTNNEKQTNEIQNNEQKANETSTDNGNTQVEEQNTNIINNIDKARVINGDSNTTYSNEALEISNSFKKFKGDKEFDIIKVELQSDLRSVIVTINWEPLKYNAEDKEYKYTISNFNSNIKKVFVSGWGQAIGKETIFYLMEDGTVEYTPLTAKLIASFDNLETVVLKNHGKLQGVENVSTFAIVSASVVNDISSWEELIAIREDGSFYSISNILDKNSDYTY